MRSALLAFLLVASASAAAAQADPRAELFHLRPNDVVLFLGDSITHETKYMYQMYYSKIVKQYAEMQQGEAPYANTGWGTPALRFVNGGVSGDTAGGGLQRLPALLAQHKPTVCMVGFGMNDRYKDRANYLANMKGIVAKLKQAKVEITLCTSPCVSAVGHPELEPFVKILGDMAGEVKALAAAEGVLFADCYTPTRTFMEEKKIDFTYGDGIHTDNDKYSFIADAILATWNLGKPLPKAGQPRGGQYPAAPAKR